MEERTPIPVTALLILKKENEVLLLRRFNTGYEDGKYCFPGGHVEKGEEIQDAVIREAKEEIGITIDKNNLKIANVLQRKTADNSYIDFIFECTEWSGNETLMEKDKSDDIQWFHLGNLPNNMLPFMKDVLKEDKKNFYIPLGWEEKE